MFSLRVEDGLKELLSIGNNSVPVVGPVESDPEYKLIVDSNNILVEIDDDLLVIHKFARDHYSKRFPELESLVPGSAEYLLTVQEIGNDLGRVSITVIFPNKLS